MPAFALLALACATALAAYALTGLAVRVLTRRAVLDRPNERSSHSVPTPRGGGLAVVAALVPALLVVAVAQGAMPRLLALLAGLAGLAALSFLDDLRDLSARLRILGQAAAVLIGMVALPEGSVTQDLLPFWLDRSLVFVGWLWFVNLFNFMDGIDGITAVETIAIGLGVAVVAGLLAPLGTVAAMGLMTAAAAIGFLPWNWRPARIFLGDVGSVPLGFVQGFLLLSLAAEGLWAPALAIPLYYCLDATLTLLKRLARGERVWEAHRSHWYQRAAAATRHDTVSLRVAFANALLVAVAAASVLVSPYLVVVAGAVAAGLLIELDRLARRPRRA